MAQYRRFFIDNKVKYVGERRISKKSYGRIVGYVKHIGESQTEFETVVEFGDGSYVVRESELSHYNSSDKEELQVDVQRISRKWDDE